MTSFTCRRFQSKYLLRLLIISLLFVMSRRQTEVSRRQPKLSAARFTLLDLSMRPICERNSRKMSSFNASLKIVYLLYRYEPDKKAKKLFWIICRFLRDFPTFPCARRYADLFFELNLLTLKKRKKSFKRNNNGLFKNLNSNSSYRMKYIKNYMMNLHFFDNVGLRKCSTKQT